MFLLVCHVIAFTTLFVLGFKRVLKSKEANFYRFEPFIYLGAHLVIFALQIIGHFYILSGLIAFFYILSLVIWGYALYILIRSSNLERLILLTLLAALITSSDFVAYTIHEQDLLNIN